MTAFASVHRPNGPENAPIRVVVVDDHEAFAKGLVLLLDAHAAGRIEIVGMTKAASDAIRLVRESGAELAIVDLAMPPPGGVHAIGAIKASFPDVSVLALTASEDSVSAHRALGAGADGFLGKSTEPADLVGSILTLRSGQAVIPRWLLNEMLANGTHEARVVLATISDDDRRLWVSVARGAEISQICEQFHVSERTAKRMVAALLRRIGAANRVEAAGRAGQAGLLDGHAPSPIVRAAVSPDDWQP